MRQISCRRWFCPVIAIAHTWLPGTSETYARLCASPQPPVLVYWSGEVVRPTTTDHKVHTREKDPVFTDATALHIAYFIQTPPHSRGRHVNQ